MTENKLIPYAILNVRDRDVTGYLAIGFVDARNDIPPMRPRRILGQNAIVRVMPHESGDLKGSAIYVLSSSRAGVVRRIQNLAGNRSLRPMTEETSQNLQNLQ